MRGFTLIETIVYLGLFAIVMTGLVATSYGYFGNIGRNETKAILQEEKDFILNSLAEFNESQVRDARVREFGIFASNESGAIVAGLLGFTLWNGCFISALWVAETL